MPTYAYVCPKCGHEFEKVHKMTAKTQPRCPRCRAVAEQKITGGVGLLFKGSGFYITDYKHTAKDKEGPQKSADAKPEAPKADASKPKKGSDS